MPELLRSIIARLRSLAGNRRRARRYRVRLPLEVSLLGVKSKAESAVARPPAVIPGYTRDLSATGIALVVPTIRAGEHYLTGEGRRLLVTLHPPDGALAIEVSPVRYEQLDESETETGYLIGVHITEMSDADRARFDAYLQEKG
jgi:c-di-GMP-binding flagellar brake protein YcgR